MFAAVGYCGGWKEEFVIGIEIKFNGKNWNFFFLARPISRSHRSPVPCGSGFHALLLLLLLPPLLQKLLLSLLFFLLILLKTLLF